MEWITIVKLLLDVVAAAGFVISSNCPTFDSSRHLSILCPIALVSISCANHALIVRRIKVPFYIHSTTTTWHGSFAINNIRVAIFLLIGISFPLNSSWTRRETGFSHNSTGRIRDLTAGNQSNSVLLWPKLLHLKKSSFSCQWIIVIRGGRVRRIKFNNKQLPMWLTLLARIEGKTLYICKYLVVGCVTAELGYG